MPPVNNEVLAKLQKILARADTSRGASEGEALAAMAAAQRLAAQHSIDLSTVTLSGEVKSNAIDTDDTKVHTSTKYERTFHAEILHILRECFEIQTVMSSYWTPQAQRVISSITFIGEKTDVALARYCWDWLQALFPQLWSEYRRNTGTKPGWTAERSYYRGLGAGIRENNKRARQEMPQDESRRFAIVVASKREAVQAHTAKLFPKLGSTRTFSKQTDHGAFAAGAEKGRSIKLNGGLGAGASVGAIR